MASNFRFTPRIEEEAVCGTARVFPALIKIRSTWDTPNFLQRIFNQSEFCEAALLSPCVTVSEKASKLARRHEHRACPKSNAQVGPAAPRKNFSKNLKVGFGSVRWSINNTAHSEEARFATLLARSPTIKNGFSCRRNSQNRNARGAQALGWKRNSAIDAQKAALIYLLGSAAQRRCTTCIGDFIRSTRASAFDAMAAKKFTRGDAKRLTSLIAL